MRGYFTKYCTLSIDGEQHGIAVCTLACHSKGLQIEFWREIEFEKETLSIDYYLKIAEWNILEINKGVHYSSYWV